MKILAVMLKDLRLVARDRSAFAFLLAVPIVVDPGRCGKQLRRWHPEHRFSGRQ